MADGPANRSPARGRFTICLPVEEAHYAALIDDSERFRAWVTDAFAQSPELFPEGFAAGFQLKDRRCSRKQQLAVRRIQLRDGTVYSIRPSFVLPYMSGRVADVDAALFLRGKFGVPYWGLARAFGRDPMFWFRLECSLGRNSVVGTTVRQRSVPEHLLADEHHQTRNGQKVYLATTVGAGCCLGVAVAETASTEDLTAAYSVFRAEARDVTPDYTPQTVNTDGWKGTRAAWQQLFAQAVLLRCFLHAWLKIRDRAKHLKADYHELSRRVWETYHATGKRSCAQRLRRLRTWAQTHLIGVVLQAVVDLCDKKAFWLQGYDHPGGHRTSNMLDRTMRSMHRYWFDSQHLHGQPAANERHVRGWALLANFAPWHPAITKANGGWQSPAERLNQHRYHANWLQNLFISASLGGYRAAPQKA